jgi:hypothetical protein
MATAHEIETLSIEDQEIERLLIIYLNSDFANRIGSSNSSRNSASDQSLHPHGVEATYMQPPARFIRKNKSSTRPPSGPASPLVDSLIEPCWVQSGKSSTLSEASHTYDFILESLLQPDYLDSIDLLPPEDSTIGDLNSSLD